MQESLSLRWKHPVKCFNKNVQSAVNIRRQRYENPYSSVDAEYKKLLANGSYGSQIMNPIRNSVTKFTNVEEKHALVNKELFKNLEYINDQIYQVEPAESEIEFEEPIIVGLFLLQYTKLRILELY